MWKKKLLIGERFNPDTGVEELVDAEINSDIEEPLVKINWPGGWVKNPI